jgi:hypothetical protein
MLCAFRLDADDPAVTLKQDVEVRRDPADPVRALRLEDQAFAESGQPGESQPARLVRPGAEGFLELGASDARQEVVLEFDDVAVPVELNARAGSRQSSPSAARARPATPRICCRCSSSCRPAISASRSASWI